MLFLLSVAYLPIMELFNFFRTVCAKYVFLSIIHNSPYYPNFAGIEQFLL